MPNKLGRRVYRQIKNEDGTSSLIELGNPSAPLSSDLRVDKPFLSPIDGSVIRSKLDLNDHNKRNNVIQMSEGHTQDIAATNQENRDRVSGTRGRQERIKTIRRIMEQGEG